jgi:hypothetical protein
MGWAYNGTIGWISFSGLNTGTAPYQVKTDADLKWLIPSNPKVHVGGGDVCCP